MPTNLISKSLLGRLATAAVLGVFLICVLAPRLASAGDELPYGQGLLWKVERAGAAPSYLFGTIHITDERVLDLPAPVRQAFDTAQSATFEIIMTDELRLKLAQSMVLQDGRTLDAIVGAERFRAATAAGARYGLAAEHIRYFKPWALATLLSVPQAELMRAATGKVPLDQWLQVEAGRQGKAVYALETGEEQIALFNDLAEADQIQMLDGTIKDNARIETLFEELTQRYLDGDIGGIYTDMLMQSSSMSEEFRELFLLRFNEARNRTMVARMADRLAEGGAFIAVGALHLPGERGLLSLLAGDGFRIQRAY